MLKPLFLLAIVFRCQASAQPLIPRSLTVGSAEYSFIDLSPDGQYLSYLQLWEGVPNIFIKRLQDNRVERLTLEKKSAIVDCGWTYKTNTVYYIKQKQVDQNYRVYLMNVATGESRILVENDRVQPTVLAQSPKLPDTLVIRMNDRDPRFFDYYRINTTNGRMEMIFENIDGYNGYEFDDDLRLVMILKEHPNTSVTYYSVSETNRGQYQPVRTFDLEDDRSYCINFDAKNGVVYWWDTTVGDKSAIVVEFLNNRTRRVIHRGIRSDLYYVSHPFTRKFLQITENYLKPTVVWEEESFGKHFNVLQTQFPNLAVSIVDYSADFSLWLVSVASDVNSTKLYLYNLPNQTIRYLLSYRKELDNYDLSPMFPVEIPIVDNLIQVCYLVLPRSSDPGKTGRPDKPLPMLLMVHGGPWNRLRWGLDLPMQHWASRGYAALNCNFRGSTGLGKRFLTASYGEWGKKMQQDLVDAVHWAIAEKIADPSKVAIFGHSYGGYAALAGMTFSPELFACGVSFAGLSNMITSLSSNMPARWTSLRPGYVRKVGGDPDTVEGRKFLKSISPVYFAHRVKRPLLLIHGADDSTVSRNESDQMAAALRRNNATFKYIVFDGEDHNFVRHENRIARTAITESFLASCLGGTVEPYQEETLSRSTIKIL